MSHPVGRTEMGSVERFRRRPATRVGHAAIRVRRAAIRVRLARTVALCAVAMALGVVALGGCGSGRAAGPVGTVGRAGTAPAGAGLITVRFGVISSGGGAEVPLTMVSTGIAARYGIKVVTVPYTTPGQQYLLARGGAADVVPGDILDLVRQRRAGLRLFAFLGFQRYDSAVVVGAHSPLTAFGQLAGKRVGEFGPTLLDWLVVRAAGERADGVDVGHAAHLTQASPVLLESLLGRGRIDAALEFSSLSVAPVALRTQRVLVTVPELMRRAGFDPDALDVTWDVTATWLAAHPGGLTRVRAAMQATYARLATDAGLWAPLVKLLDIRDPTVARAYIASERASTDPPFRAALLGPTQALIDGIARTAGAEVVGFRQLPSDAFLFPP